MTKCASCLNEARDLAQCSVCLKCFDFACGGITESGYRKLGDRKAAWKCPNCKNSSNLKQAPTPPLSVLEEKLSTVENKHKDAEDVDRRILILEDLIKQKDQNDRLNNAEFKGVLIKDSENLFEIVSKLGSSINLKNLKSELDLKKL
ncbi:hypothetical protein ACJJTC_016916 [Scirpophaga incertulas]